MFDNDTDRHANKGTQQRYVAWGQNIKLYPEHENETKIRK